eukprot:1658722-Rhodomonas_salina.1
MTRRMPRSMVRSRPLYSALSSCAHPRAPVCTRVRQCAAQSVQHRTARSDAHPCASACSTQRVRQCAAQNIVLLRTPVCVSGCASVYKTEHYALQNGVLAAYPLSSTTDHARAYLLQEQPVADTVVSSTYNRSNLPTVARTTAGNSSKVLYLPADRGLPQYYHVGSALGRRR